MEPQGWQEQEPDKTRKPGPNRAERRAARKDLKKYSRQPGKLKTSNVYRALLANSVNKKPRP